MCGAQAISVRSRSSSEGAVAAGVRRVEAVTGADAIAHAEQLESLLGEASAALRSTPDELPGRVRRIAGGAQAP